MGKSSKPLAGVTTKRESDVQSQQLLLVWMKSSLGIMSVKQDQFLSFHFLDNNIDSSMPDWIMSIRD